ncbi:hypothetical protein QBC39DRAFT_387216 [Podospora conica]|nr:hypothetical protein QBC39DRAFT_387216 [Schizothecium conicum]
MAEIAAFVIGTSGLISVAEVCLAIARAIDGNRAFKEDSASLFAMYNFEQVRLALWIAHVVGITDAPLDINTLQIEERSLPPVLTRESPINLHAPLHSALTEVARLLKKIDNLLDKYGANEASVSRRIRFQTRIFKEGGKDEIEKLLGQLKYWNDGLDGVVENRMRHDLLSNMHVRLLSAAQTDVELGVIQGAAQLTHPSLAHEAAFRRQLLGTGSRSKGELKVELKDISPSIPPQMKKGALRAMGTIAGPGKRPIRVLQEWKHGQANWGRIERKIASERADGLASDLHLEHKPSKLRCLDLVAYAITDGPDGRLDFGFFYHPPPFADGMTLPLTLHTALATLSERRQPTLPQRFGMAATLAESLLAFHMANWVHKAVWSPNILFFADADTGAHNFGQPFVAGFEFARPDTVADRSIDSSAGGVPGFDAYCHPELVASLTGDGSRGRKRYQRRYDIYGLGVVLLELGCWMTAASILKSMQGVEGSSHEHLYRTASTSLPSRMGTKYKQAVRACLDWEEDEDAVEVGVGPETDELRAQRQRQRQRQIEMFANTVVAALRDCHCSL